MRKIRVSGCTSRVCIHKDRSLVDLGCNTTWRSTEKPWCARHAIDLTATPPLTAISTVAQTDATNKPIRSEKEKNLRSFDRWDVVVVWRTLSRVVAVPARLIYSLQNVHPLLGLLARLGRL